MASLMAIPLRRRQRKSSTNPFAQYTALSWVLLVAVIVIPLAYGIYLSFLNYRLTSVVPPTFVGLENYRLVLADDVTWSSFRITVAITLMGMAVQVPIGLMLAVILAMGLRGTQIFRSVLITPMLLMPVAVGLMFRFMFETDIGVINWALSEIGLPRVNWLGAQLSALITVVIVDSWQSIPFIMLVMLAALAGVPKSLNEAAKVDGASASQAFFRVTLPLITPALLVVVMIKIMDFLKLFDTLFTLTRGGPGNETTTLGLWTYKTGFLFLEMSRGASLGVLILLLTVPVYFLWRRSTRRIR